MTISIDVVVTVTDLDPDAQQKILAYAAHLLSCAGDDQDFAHLGPMPKANNLPPDERRRIFEAISEGHKIDTHPIAAMLASYVSGNRTEAALHEQLKAMVLRAAIRFPTRTEAIRVACRRVRLIDTQRSRCLFQALQETDGTLESVVSRLLELELQQAKAPLKKSVREGRVRLCAGLRVLLSDYLHDREPRGGRLHGTQEPMTEGTVSLDGDDLLADTTADQRVIYPVHNHGTDTVVLTPSPSERRLDYRVVPAAALKAVTTKQRADARQATAEIQMRRVGAPAIWSSLTRNEVKATLKTCFSAIESRNSSEHALIGMAISLGRQPTMLLSTPLATEKPRISKEYWDIGGDRVHLVVPLDLPDLGPHSQTRVLLKRGLQQFRLALPNRLDAAAREVLRMPAAERTPGSPLARRVRDAISEMNGADHLRLSEKRIARFMHDRLVAGGVDEVVVRRLCGRPHKANIPQYYDSTPHSLTQRVHNGYMRDILSMVGRDEDWTPLPVNDEPLGSSLHVPPETVRDIFSCWRHCIDGHALRQQDPVGFHNDYVLAVYAILSLCTGYRPVRRMFETINDYDPIGKQLFIADKRSRIDSGSRQIVLPDLACQQIAQYLHHLDQLKRRVWICNREAARAAEGAINGSAPLLFRVEATSGEACRIRYFDPREAKGWLADFYDLPLNWPRHFLCTACRQAGFPHELINVLLGHEDLGPASCDRFSGVSYRDMAGLAAELDTLLRSLGIRPIWGLR